MKLGKKFITMIDDLEKEVISLPLKKKQKTTLLCYKKTIYRLVNKDWGKLKRLNR